MSRFSHPRRFLLILLAAFCLCDARPLSAENLSPLGKTPDWSKLEKFQDTITHDDFVRLLQAVYAPRTVSAELITVKAGDARILMNKESQSFMTLRFAKSDAARRPLARTWAAANSLPARKSSGVLSDVRIAIDPGHIGGAWAKMEERWFQIGNSAPVEEGEMTLQVAQLLVPRLQALGAKVTLVRDKSEPVTTSRPDEFLPLAREVLRKSGLADPRDKYDGPNDPAKEQTVQWQSELLFYRNSEIRARAELVNKRLRPDLVLCLHFNAEAWGDPAQPTLVDNNHLHLLVNGSYSDSELQMDDERFEMLERLLARCYPEEISVAEKLAETMARLTGLPAYEYKTANVTKVGLTGYVFARNLLATRLFQCPVVYLEPYVMNSKDGYARIQAGDYEGKRTVNGIERASIYREYVEGIVTGLTEYYRHSRQ